MNPMSDELTERIIGAAIEVHRILGPGLLKSVYEEALCQEFTLRGIPYERQVYIDVPYKEIIIRGKQRLDLLVAREVIVELKSVSTLPKRQRRSPFLISAPRN
jgi:GxxExxY protein